MFNFKLHIQTGRRFLQWRRVTKDWRQTNCQFLVDYHQVDGPVDWPVKCPVNWRVDKQVNCKADSRAGCPVACQVAFSVDCLVSMMLHQECSSVHIGYLNVNGTSYCPGNSSSLLYDSREDTLSRMVELYAVTVVCCVGILGNALSFFAFRRDADRHGLLLMQTLTLADGFYLLMALARYPPKHLMNDQVLIDFCFI